jgi:hypothetical protein
MSRPAGPDASGARPRHHPVSPTREHGPGDVPGAREITLEIFRVDKENGCLHFAQPLQFYRVNLNP